MEFLNIEGALIPHQVINIRGDGACMFSSLSYLMYGEDNRAQEVRRQIVQYICRNWRRFKPFTMLESGDPYKTKAQYLESMMKHNTFGTTCELMAAGELYRYEFQVYRNGIMMITVGEASDGVKRLQFSGDLMRGHFNVLVPQVERVQASQETLNSLQGGDLMEVEVSHASRMVDNESISSTETVEQNVHHRGKKRRKRFTHNIRKKQLIEANTSYTKKKPDVNKKAVSKYQNKHSHDVQQANQNYNDVRRKERLKPWSQKSLSALDYNPEINYANDKIVCLGDLVTCQWCLAKKWKHESPGLCCCGGKVRLPPPRLLPEPLFSLLTNNHPESEHFLINLRKYNSCFQMTSFGAKEIREGNFMPTFKVQGQVYHRIGSLLPPPELQPAFLQIYFVGDDEKETDIRCQNFPATKPYLVRQLQTMLHQYNPYIREFKIALESTPIDVQFKVVIQANKKPADGHRGRFNAPVTNEVAVVIVGQEFDRRDIILHSRDASLKRVSETHRSYDALQYPLMFCFGEDGYAIDIPQRHPDTQAALNKTVSAASFYAYLIMERQNTENMLLLFRGLLNQFLVDMYAKIETERLNFIRCNQTSLRAENYVHLRDAVQQSDGDIGEIGKMVILPSSFTGGPRYMHERTQDAMTYVRIYGRPDLFITFTSSPKWHDIHKQLKDGQKPQDRHDLVARVFHLKLKQMMNLLTKGQVFGPTICYMYTCEWQKRGLPHSHILIWLFEKIRPHEIDHVISAEIPNVEDDPILHEVVTKNMIHGPCGTLNQNAPCMVDGICSKRYPRTLVAETITGNDGYPLYRRRSIADNGRSTIVKVNRQEIEVDNRWIVPYSPVLSKTFKAHINVESCHSVKSIKYICKYVTKGSDMAMIGISAGNSNDEIIQYQMGRYVSSNEAMWRIFSFPIHERYPAVIHLAVHLENGQRVYFTVQNAIQRVDQPPSTTLTSFFDLCETDEFAKNTFVL
uniref:OTU domain-containing protein n=1 Tax=Cacopsylla melanoneura TaxID=428564 RepID=A0A8D9E7B6_9HEMI